MHPDIELPNKQEPREKQDNYRLGEDSDLDKNTKILNDSRIRQTWNKYQR